MDYDQSKSRCTFHGGGTETGKEKVPKCQHIGEDRVAIKLWNKCWLAGHDQQQTTKRLSEMDQEKGPLCSEDTGRNPRSCDSWAVFPSGSVLSAGPCSQQSRSSCTMQAASEWFKSFLFRPCVIKKKQHPNWCSFVLYKGSTFLAPSSRLMGY